MSKEIIVLVGLPRSGKTTWRNHYIKNYEGDVPVVICADDIRYLLYGQRFFSGGEPFVWATRDIMFKCLMQQGKTIIIDETNVVKYNRSKIIAEAKKYEYSVTAIIFPTSREACIARAIWCDDDYIVPIINSMADKYEPVLINEGFTLIYTEGGDYRV